MSYVTQRISRLVIGFVILAENALIAREQVSHAVFGHHVQYSQYVRSYPLALITLHAAQWTVYAGTHVELLTQSRTVQLALSVIKLIIHLPSD